VKCCKALLIWARVRCIVWTEMRPDILSESSRRVVMAWGQLQSVRMLVWEGTSNSGVGIADALADVDVRRVLVSSLSNCHRGDNAELELVEGILW
jgi:hypothetical protein